MVYLLKMEGRYKAYYKIGFTAQEPEKRFKQYATHNCIVRCMEIVATYSKTGYNLETALHKELLNKGFTFEEAEINGQETEWFSMPFEQADEFDKKGLLNFKACQNRKIIRYKRVKA